MKKNKTLLIISAIILGTSTCFAQGSSQSSLQGKIILKTPSMVSQEAGKNSFSESSGLGSDPFVNSYMGAMSNMLNNNSTSSYYLQEQQKLQVEYAKQKTDK